MYSAIVPVSKEAILSLLTPYDIFRKYIPGYEPETTRSSPLAIDKHASFWSKIDIKGRIWFKDYARNVQGDCFTLVQEIYHCDFMDALNHINVDFNLKLGEPNVNFDEVRSEIEKYQVKAPTPKEAANIQIAKREWEIHDLQYWAEHGISYQTLLRFNVVPINFYWIRDYKFRADKYAYSWMVYDKRKIYQPFNENNKWAGDLRSNYVQGLQFLPKSGTTLLLQSSLKDIMSVLEIYSLNGVAGSSETTPIPNFILDDLETRFTNIYVLHDGDKAGWNSATELAYQRRYVNISLPELMKGDRRIKDPSDYIKYGSKSLLDEIFKLYKLIP